MTCDAFATHLQRKQVDLCVPRGYRSSAGSQGEAEVLDLRLLDENIVVPELTAQVSLEADLSSVFGSNSGSMMKYTSTSLNSASSHSEVKASN